MDEYKIMTMEELIQQGLPPETHEENYRRGYRDGWIQAVGEMHDLMFRSQLSRQAAYDECFAHFEGRLFAWMWKAQDGAEVGLVLPPRLKRVQADSPYDAPPRGVRSRKK